MEKYPALFVSGLTDSELVRCGSLIEKFAVSNAEFERLLQQRASSVDNSIEMIMNRDADEDDEDADDTIEVSNLLENIDISDE